MEARDTVMSDEDIEMYFLRGSEAYCKLHGGKTSYRDYLSDLAGQRRIAQRQAEISFEAGKRYLYGDGRLITDDGHMDGLREEVIPLWGAKTVFQEEELRRVCEAQERITWASAFLIGFKQGKKASAYREAENILSKIEEILRQQVAIRQLPPDWAPNQEPVDIVSYLREMDVERLAYQILGAFSDLVNTDGKKGETDVT